MKIAFLLSSLGAGGAERVASMLMNAWSKKHQVIFINYQSAESEMHYTLEKGITSENLDMLAVSSGLFQTAKRTLSRVKAVQKCLEAHKPDILICFMSENNIVGTIAGRLAGIPVVISERIHPEFHSLPNLHKYARKIVYPFSKSLVVQTTEIAKWFRRFLELDAEVIANPIDIAAVEAVVAKNNINGSRKTLMAMGRLDPQKGYKLLIESFSRLADDFPEWDLWIFGQGPEKDALHRQIKLLGLDGRVELKGVVRDAYSWLKSGSLFVHPALYEGFPNTILEAMACNLPIVASDCPGASRELLQGGEVGWLFPVGDLSGLTGTLSEAMMSENSRLLKADRARQSVNQFDINEISEQWLSLFLKISEPNDRFVKCKVSK